MHACHVRAYQGEGQHCQSQQAGSDESMEQVNSVAVNAVRVTNHSGPLAQKRFDVRGDIAVENSPSRGQPNSMRRGP